MHIAIFQNGAFEKEFLQNDRAIAGGYIAKGWDRRSDCTECKIMEPGLEMHYRNCGLQDAIAHNASQCAWVVEMHYRNCGLQDASGSSPCNDASGPSRSAGPRRRGWVVSGERLWCWRYFDFLQKAHFTFHLLPSSDFKVHSSGVKIFLKFNDILLQKIKRTDAHQYQLGGSENVWHFDPFVLFFFLSSIFGTTVFFVTRFTSSEHDLVMRHQEWMKCRWPAWHTW